VDGCRAGWLVASATSPARAPTFEIVATFPEVVRRILEAGGVGAIDVPIGLVEGARRCDREARRLLGRFRASSVFTPPCRGALAATGRARIRALNVAATGRSLSEQALGITGKIREVDLAMTPALQARVREVHPEVVFAARSGTGAGLAASKKTAEGRSARLSLLPPAWADAARAVAFRRKDSAPDDVVDALAALAAALRIASGRARRLPEGPEERDRRGLVMEIVY
jgi:predicted RNase H-like nuclease